MSVTTRLTSQPAPGTPARPAPELPIRMLALDIDGTLVGHDITLSERTIAAIREAIARGVKVSLATGRTPGSAVVFATRLGIVEPIVGHQGAVIRAMPAPDHLADAALLDSGAVRGRVGTLLRHRPMAADVVRDALAWCWANGLQPHINHLERVLVQDDDPHFEDYSAYFGKKAETYPDLIAAIRTPKSKVISVGEPPRPMEMVGEARRVFAGRAWPTVSHPRFLEFVAPGVSKGHAVAWLAHRAGIPMGQVMTMGDALNDLEMIVAAGHGTAMATAPAEVRAHARYIAAPVSEDGSAALIEALVLASPADARRNAVRLAEEACAAREALGLRVRLGLAEGPDPADDGSPLA
jgi:Cof subfamily protein (haloacid dehalogenase superfamily)